jgi:hypothetical protein
MIPIQEDEIMTDNTRGEKTAKKKVWMTENEKAGLVGVIFSVAGAGYLFGIGGVLLVFGLELLCSSLIAHAMGER